MMKRKNQELFAHAPVFAADALVNGMAMTVTPKFADANPRNAQIERMLR